jgi:hypothetical protein
MFGEYVYDVLPQFGTYSFQFGERQLPEFFGRIYRFYLFFHGDKSTLSVGKKDGEEEAMRERAGRREEGGEGWATEVGGGVEIGSSQLFGLQADVAGGVIGGETDHKVAWERPGLTAVVTDILDAEAGFFADFPCGALLKALADFEEAGDEAVMAGGSMGVGLDEENIFASAYKNEDSGGDSGKYLVPAGRTAAEDGQLGGFGGCAASGAETAMFAPMEKLSGAANEFHLVIGEVGESLAEGDGDTVGWEERGIGFEGQGQLALLLAKKEVPLRGELDGERVGVKRLAAGGWGRGGHGERGLGSVSVSVEGGLGSGDAGDGYAERRAGNVVEADTVAEFH